MLSITGEQCCRAPQVKDLSQGLGELRHFYCAGCKAHTYRGVFYTRRQWDEWVNSEDENEA